MAEERAPTLERQLSRLAEIVAKLEREDVELEEALALFEEGIGSVRAAEERLRAAELRLERLIEERGEALLEPMEPAGE